MFCFERVGDVRWEIALSIAGHSRQVPRRSVGGPLTESDTSYSPTKFTNH